jgi:hypothetical protein
LPSITASHPLRLHASDRFDHSTPRVRPDYYSTTTATDTHVGFERARRICGGSLEKEYRHWDAAVTDREALSLCTDTMAQVLSSRSEGSHFHTPMRSPSSNSLFTSNYSLRKNQTSLPDLRVNSASSSRTSSLRSTPSSTLSLDTKSDESSSEDDGLSLPNYGNAQRQRKPTSYVDMEPTSYLDTPTQLPHAPSPSPADSVSADTTLTTPDPVPMAEDDTAVRKEPSHHVDYLSYDWREEDIWSSWRHIVEHRNVYGERSRLENASWRTWAKAQFKLKTVTPDSLNW